jgi:hypothetical protein
LRCETPTAAGGRLSPFCAGAATLKTKMEAVFPE